jgi:hypothetical protein
MRVLVLGIVLLAASIGTAQAEDRKCIRDMTKLTGDMTKAKRLCDPKNYVTDPNEYGWVCDVPEPVKGAGAKQKKDVFCD